MTVAEPAGSAVLLLAAAAAHAGFQATVTLLVYPALARVRPEDWAAAHRRHSTAIAPLVAVVYAALLVAVGWAVADAPSAPTYVAAAGAGLAFATTAASAAPTHRRLGAGHDPALIGRLLAVDRVRLAGALVCLAGAVAAT